MAKKQPLGGPKKDTPGVTNEVYRVNPWRYEADRQSLLYAAAGMSNKFINSKNGQSNGQIYYRTRHFGISRKDIRNGVHPLSKVILSVVERELEPALMTYLKKHL